jgi:hypothetical protein
MALPQYAEKRARMSLCTQGRMKQQAGKEQLPWRDRKVVACESVVKPHHLSPWPCTRAASHLVV